MKAIVRRMTAAAAAVAVCISSGAVNVFAITPNTTVIPSYKNEAPASGCVKAGIAGSYTADIQDALDRINEIRLEACKKGYPDPGNPSRKLTKSDYVPIKWSASLETEARVRAAEASVRIDHTRPNDLSPFTLAADDVWDSSEVLAWNWNETIVSGIEQFYTEKNDWVNQDSTKVTGHYTSMIDPDNTYVGMSAFQPDSGSYNNTVAGRFGQTKSGKKADESRSKAVSDCVATVIINKSYLSKPTLVRVGGSSTLVNGAAARYEMRADADVYGAKSELILCSGIKWTTSNSKVATVDSYGRVTAKGAGSVTITASCGGYKASKIITVTDNRIKNASVSLTKGNTYTYSGRTINPSVTVKLGSKTLKKNTDYTVIYKNNINTGRASCTIKGKGKYTGSKTVYFYIKPKKQTITQVTKPAKGSVKLRWKRDTQADGVQIFYALNSKYTGKGSVTVRGNSKTAKTITGLKRNRTYYIKLRSYKIANGKKLYGVCSKTVKVKTK